MKNHKSYLIGSLCMVVATVILLIASAYLVPTLAPGSQSNVALASPGDPRPEDPLVAFNFMLELDGHLVGYFTRCSHIGSESEVIKWKDTDPQGHVVIRKIPGELAWNNVILARGITSSTELWEWRKLVEEGKGNDARHTAYIKMFDRGGAEVVRWKLTAAWPCRIEGPSVLGSGEIGIEEIEITCERMERVF